MAEDKKSGGKDEIYQDPFVELVFTIAGIMIIVYALNSIFLAVTSGGLFNNGLQGLTPRGIYINNSVPISSLDNPIGADVVSINQTKVLSSPGGASIGEQKIGARGKILQGPVEINGKRYWYVDYESGPDGWVLEDDIRAMQGELNFIEKTIIWLFYIYKYFKFFVIVLSILMIFAIIHLFRKIMHLYTAERNMLYPSNGFETSITNPQWEKVLKHIESTNQNDWRLAILEADIMLADILDRLYLPGDTVGEKLKAVEESDFTTKEKAWEAHKVRNQIAHEGSSFMLDQKRAKEIIALYQEVFEEFHII